MQNRSGMNPCNFYSISFPGFRMRRALRDAKETSFRKIRMAGVIVLRAMGIRDRPSASRHRSPIAESDFRTRNRRVRSAHVKAYAVCCKNITCPKSGHL
jgi:hypothetical protein